MSYIVKQQDVDRSSGEKASEARAREESPECRTLPTPSSSTWYRGISPTPRSSRSRQRRRNLCALLSLSICACFALALTARADLVSFRYHTASTIQRGRSICNAQSRVTGLACTMMNSVAPALVGLIAAASAVTALKLDPTKPTESETTSFFGGKDATILRHPADWSRDIQPIGVHSHNDYWRDTPVLDALAHGVRSIESDVWLMDGELYVGHDPYSLSPERTFESLTLTPLRKAIDQANDANALLSNRSEATFFKPLQEELRTNDTLRWNGFYTAGVGNAAPIQLLVDLKTEGRSTLDATVKALRPLEQKGYLTTYKDGKISKGPIIVIGTGNTPTDALAGLQNRNIFVDCPLGKLDDDVQVEGESFAYNSTLCGVASTSLGALVPGYKGLTEASEGVMANLSRAIEEAHSKGIATRVWDTPVWPSFVRDRVNELLLGLGSDWINADDLDAIQKW